jgi:hypothetical protein
LFRFSYNCLDACFIHIKQLLFDEECERFGRNTRDKCDSVISDKAIKMLSEEVEDVAGNSSVFIGNGDGGFISTLQPFTSVIHGICEDKTEYPVEQSLSEFIDLSESGSLNSINIKIIIVTKLSKM